ncbi:hypothetical protein TWF730_005129 [Orbilia blumenaviensis]|uniref:Uncharacterized protein n=1 Tax=Orbilia blumenaviensis TaxID=1796055 RepID=A0AAV9VKP7_9PEZI
MYMQNIVVVVAGMAATASASAAIPANPVVKHLAARAINVDGTFAGLIFKRQTSCPAGYTACGSGCSLGPCCDSGAGLACRPGEVCSQIDGEMGCCPEGYVCNGIRSCQNAVGGYCTPGSVDNGVLCCDAAAPLCSTSAGIPYCAGVAPSTVVTVNPYPTGGQDGGFDTTTTTSFTTTSTLTLTLDSTSNAIPPTYATGETETATEAPSSELPTEAPSSELPTEAPSSELPTEVPTSITAVEPTITTTLSETYVVPTIPTSITDSFTIQTSTPTYAAGPSTSTLTSTAIIVIPYPPTNGTNATATGGPSPPEATGAAGKLGVSGFALTIAFGLAFLL